MEDKEQLEIRKYLDIITRRKWFIIIPFLIITSGAVLLAFTLPPLYRSSTLILVEQQKVPPDYVKPTIGAGVKERLATISQQILSRTRLESIIKEFNLYPRERQKEPLEVVVEMMRKDIGLEVRGTDAFRIEYRGRDPRLTMLVANKLASLYIEENLKVREQQAVSTTDFLDNELRNLREVLERQEKAVQDFKLRYMGELPGELEANLRGLDRLNLQLQSVEASIISAQERSILLETQIGERRKILANVSPLPLMPQAPGMPVQVPLSRRLEELKARLANLMASGYTEKYPDVVMLKREIKEVEAQIASSEPEETSPPGASEGGKKAQAKGEDLLDPGILTLKGQLDSLKVEIKNLMAEKANIRRQIAVLQERVRNTPQREQQLAVLTRDYDNTLQNYRTLLDKRLNAQIAENMEKRQKGEQFRILDPANLPEKPFKPNRPKMILLGLLLGLAIGLGTAFIAENMDTSFKGEEEVKEFTGVPVLVTLPRMGEREPRIIEIADRVAKRIMSLRGRG